MGVDNNAVHILLQGLRTGLSDGWGGSMIASDVSDVLCAARICIRSTRVSTARRSTEAGRNRPSPAMAPGRPVNRNSSAGPSRLT